MTRTIHTAVTAIPITNVNTDRWLATPAQMKTNAAEYIGCRMNRYGPRVISDAAPGAAVTRNVPL